MRGGGKTLCLRRFQLADIRARTKKTAAQGAPLFQSIRQPDKQPADIATSIISSG
jgi:hypothetical protein